MSQYLTTEELSSRIKYDVRYIRDSLKGRIFLEGIHYIRPFGGRKILFLWDAVEDLMLKENVPADPAEIPLRRGNGR